VASGSNAAAVIKLMKQNAGAPMNVAFLVNDSGMKYLSTDLFTE
jgi:cysteine synthase